MKIEMEEDAERKFEVGYKLIEGDHLFWIDSPDEHITLKLSFAQMDKLASAIQWLKANA